MSSSPSAFDFLLGDPNASPIDVGAPPSTTKVKKDPLATFPGLDWLVLDNDVSAPHPDAFELELESLAALGGLDTDLAAFQPLVNPLDQFNPTDLYSQYRSSQYNTYSAYSGYGGAPSTITASSETLSAYGSVYEPYEKFPEPTAAQPTGAQHHHSAGDISASLSSLFPDIDLNFSAFNLAAASANTSAPEQQIMLPRLNIDTTPSSNPNTTTGDARSSSTYDSASSAASAFAGAPTYGNTHPSLAGGIGSAAANPKVEDTASSVQSETDPRKKYQCPTCPRAFARAFNLKTHMATHDPHRVKNFVCRHSGCGRSFSRKHDLGRHLVSIHQDTTPAGSSSSTSPIASGSKSSRVSPTGSVGVGGGDKQRVWCDNCGRGWLAGSRDTCDCEKEEE